jgi:hypothetical protein
MAQARIIKHTRVSLKVVLLFTGWYRTRRPIHCDHCWSTMLPHLNSWFIHQSSLKGQNRRTRRNRAQVRHSPPQIQYEATWELTHTSSVKSLRLTAWSTARPRDVSHNTHTAHNSFIKWTASARHLALVFYWTSSTKTRKWLSERLSFIQVLLVNPRKRRHW